MKFFVMCPLGAEKICFEEMREVWHQLIALDGRQNLNQFPEVKFDKGGLEFETELVLGLQLNYFLKTAGRILLRIDQFKCKDFPKLFEKIKKLDWNKYLSENLYEIEVSASKSRLNNEKRIHQTIQDALKAYYKNPAGSGTSKARIFVRVFDDEFSISVDTSGEHLHKRGYRQKQGEAPIRENLAAICLQKLIEGYSVNYLQNVILVDPMAGSGSLLFEGVSLFYPNFSRKFSFLDLKLCPKIFLSESFYKNYKNLSPHLFKKIIAHEINSELKEVMNSNYKSLCEKVNIELPSFEVLIGDFFNSMDMIGSIAKDPVFLICNPPYGERLEIKNHKDDFFNRLIQHSIDVYSPEVMGFLIPDNTKINNFLDYDQNSYGLSNSGIEVKFCVFKKTKLQV